MYQSAFSAVLHHLMGSDPMEEETAAIRSAFCPHTSSPQTNRPSPDVTDSNTRNVNELYSILKLRNKISRHPPTNKQPAHKRIQRTPACGNNILEYPTVRGHGKCENDLITITSGKQPDFQSFHRMWWWHKSIY